MRRMIAVLRCTLQQVCGAGAAARKVESRVRHFAGAAVSPYKMAARLQHGSCWLDFVSRWPGSGCSFRPTTCFLEVLSMRLERSAHALPLGSNVMLCCGRRHDANGGGWRARQPAHHSRSGVEQLRRGCSAGWWLAAVTNDSGWQQSTLGLGGAQRDHATLGGSRANGEIRASMRGCWRRVRARPVERGIFRRRGGRVGHATRAARDPRQVTVYMQSASAYSSSVAHRGRDTRTAARFAQRQRSPHTRRAPGCC